MGVRHRLQAIEERMNLGEDNFVPIIVDGRNEKMWRERVERAHERGHRLNVIRFRVQHQAETAEEAEDIVSRHRERDRPWPITVYRKGTQKDEVLAEWDPGLPEWLRDNEAHSQQHR
jgi:hypothetical protein